MYKRTLEDVEDSPFPPLSFWGWLPQSTRNWAGLGLGCRFRLPAPLVYKCCPDHCNQCPELSWHSHVTEETGNDFHPQPRVSLPAIWIFPAEAPDTMEQKQAIITIPCPKFPTHRFQSDVVVLCHAVWDDLLCSNRWLIYPTKPPVLPGSPCCPGRLSSQLIHPHSWDTWSFWVELSSNTHKGSTPMLFLL